MRFFIVLMLSVLSTTAALAAGESEGKPCPGFIWVKPAAPSTKPTATPAATSTHEPVELGDRILVGVFGDYGTQLLANYNAEPQTARDHVRLYLEGVYMDGIKPEFLGPDAFGITNNPMCPALTQPVVVLEFTLDRNAADQGNRNAWDALFARISYGEVNLHVSVAFKSELPHLAENGPLKFQCRSGTYILMVMLGGLIVAGLLLYWMVHTNMLREDGAGSGYSLGKTQMAFWGIVVAVCFAGVFIVSLKMERIPPGVLILLGISGGTGLGSVLISANKRNAAVDDLAAAAADQSKLEKEIPVMAATRDAAAQQIQALQDEWAALENERAANAGAFTPAKVARLAAIVEQLTALPATITALAQNVLSHHEKIASLIARINVRRKEARAAHTTRQWLKDIMSDPNGQWSLHRVQVVIWTVILGCIFIRAVATTFTMPEFDGTLLTLMGISSGTYLGFKFPEKADKNDPLPGQPAGAPAPPIAHPVVPAPAAPIVPPGGG